MGIVRTTTPSPTTSLPGLRVEAYGTATCMPVGISRDRKTLYGVIGSNDPVLQQSTDDGATWTTVHTFTERVYGLIETDDGEAVVYASPTATFPAMVYKSTGWSTSHTTATWALALTTPGGRTIPRWGGGHTWSFGDDLIRPGTSRVGLMCTWGVQTSGSNDTQKGVYAYLTTDYGATWTQVMNLLNRYPGVLALHLHAAAYDPYWDRLWLLGGDTNPPEGAVQTVGKSFIYYSDDRGVTWTTLSLPTDWQVSSGPTGQATTVAPLRDSILIGSDNGPGYIRIARLGYRQLSTKWQVIADTSQRNGAQMVAQHIHQNRQQAGAPLLAVNTSNSIESPALLMVSLDDGDTFVAAWEDTSLRSNAKGIVAIFGPTYNGKLVGWTDQAGGQTTNWLIRGELVIPEPGLRDAKFTVTGDGTTTVFNFAHGLGVRPTRIMGWQEKPLASGTLAVTADATNIICTFSAAPTNASVIPVQLRYAA